MLSCAGIRPRDEGEFTTMPCKVLTWVKFKIKRDCYVAAIHLHSKRVIHQENNHV